MDRREALKALTALPGLTRISVADIKPEDVIVLECERPISDETAKRIQQYVNMIFPNQKVVVLGDGLTMKVWSRSQA